MVKNRQSTTSREKSKKVSIQSRRKHPKAAKHIDYLSLLGKEKCKRRRDLLLDYASKEQIYAIAECIDNVLRGVVPLKQDQLRRLKKYKTPMRHVSDRRTPVVTKRETLKQKGGFLGALIPLAVSAIGSLIGGLTGRK